MVKAAPAGGMEWVADESPGPAELAEALEESQRRWVALGCPAEWEPPARVRLGMTPTWTREITFYTTERPCPCCAGRLRPGEACLVCSASSRNQRRWPMQDRPAPGLARAVKRRAATLRGGRG